MASPWTGCTRPRPPPRCCALSPSSWCCSILLVEDDAMIGEAIRAGLKRYGFAVDWVHEAEAAAQVLRTEPFELVLLDLAGRGRCHDRGGDPRGTEALWLRRGLGARGRGRRPGAAH